MSVKTSWKARLRRRRADGIVPRLDKGTNINQLLESDTRGGKLKEKIHSAAQIFRNMSLECLRALGSIAGNKLQVFLYAI